MKRFWLAIIIAGAARAAEPALTEAEEFCRMGRQAVRRGEYGTAVEQLERAVTLAPRESAYYHWLGNGYAWAAATAPLGDKPALGRKCLAAYQRALELDPENLPARFSLMNFYRRVPRMLGGGMARAGDQAEEIRRRDLLQGAYARAVLLADEKKYTEAVDTLGDVLRKNPQYYAANLLRGRLELESGQRLDEGVAALRRCLELAPSEFDEEHDAVTRCLGQLTARMSAQGSVAALR